MSIALGRAGGGGEAGQVGRARRVGQQRQRRDVAAQRAGRRRQAERGGGRRPLEGFLRHEVERVHRSTQTRAATRRGPCRDRAPAPARAPHQAQQRQRRLGETEDLRDVGDGRDVDADDGDLAVLQHPAPRHDVAAVGRDVAATTRVGATRDGPAARVDVGPRGRGVHEHDDPLYRGQRAVAGAALDERAELGFARQAHGAAAVAAAFALLSRRRRRRRHVLAAVDRDRRLRARRGSGVRVGTTRPGGCDGSATGACADGRDVLIIARTAERQG